MTHDLQRVKVCLPLAVSQEESKQIAKIDHQQDDHRGVLEDRQQGHVHRFRMQQPLQHERVLQQHQEHQIVEGISQNSIAEEESEKKEHMITADMAHFVGHHRFEFIAAEQSQEAAGDQDVAPPRQDADDAGGEHFTTKQRPQHEVADPETVALSKCLQLCPQGVHGEGAASPEAHHEPWRKEQAGDQKSGHEQELTWLRLKYGGEGQDLEDIGEEGYEKPRQEDGGAEGQVFPQEGRWLDFRMVDMPVNGIAVSPDDPEV